MIEFTLKIYAFKIIIGTLGSVHDAHARKKMEFKLICIRNICSVCISGIIGIIFAFNGYGIWALVFQQLSYSLINCIVLWRTVKWCPKFLFSISRAKTLLNFGGKLVIAALLQNGCIYLIQLILGKKFSEQILGYYTRGEQYPGYIVTNTSTAIGSVMFPAFSNMHRNNKEILDTVRRSIKMCTFLVFPLMLGLAIVAEPVVIILLTDKWLPCIPFLRGFCFFYALSPVQMCLMQAILALGHSDKYLKIEFVKQIIYISIIVITISGNVEMLPIAIALISIIFFFINAKLAEKILNYLWIDQLMDICPNIWISLIMGLVVHIVGKIELTKGYLLMTQVLVGGITYLIIAVILKNENLSYLLKLFKKK